MLPFSTGVIMEPLPAERIIAALPKALLTKSDWLAAAEAIMTTDTVPKAFSKKVKLSNGEADVTGIAKGAGMIRPDMATMLGFVATDAAGPAQGAAGHPRTRSPTAPSTASPSTAIPRPTIRSS